MDGINCEDSKTIPQKKPKLNVQAIYH